jgi:putative membrane-bound dehydrogenase-like protein
MFRNTAGLILLAVLLAAAPKHEPIPYNQDRPPNDPLTPAEAIRRMKVPEGFSVEVVAAEPDLVNPIAMTFDERGRIWVTESFEYPRHPAGPGRDRVKILEDTDGDGKIDRVTVFAEGLNIPSGIAVGHGGVWVANAPDILFYRIGPDGKAAGKPEVVVTGFGRDDTHELPNSLTWGPDGWLYGLNGVFNRSVVKSNNGKTYDFTCALWRIHPKTREFQLFCEGTSNPWGVAFDTEGSAFVSACVIDHLWHLAETGYYLRQGGPYPPYTWVLGSIVKHRHQKAAYCGLHYFDSDAYPPEYRDKLYMGNIHGNSINSDELTRDGATYFAKPRPDFLTSNDAWFMPVAQKTGPDGCLYILDWYDRYHCYQDANRDPAGIDRSRGRLYRIRYKDTPRTPKFDLAQDSDEKLLERLHSPNVYFRDIAQRLLGERNTPDIRRGLEQLVLDDATPRKARMHALWALVGTGSLDVGFHRRLLEHPNAAIRAWGVRAAGNFGKVDRAIRDGVAKMTRDRSPDVQLQVVVAARKLDGLDPLPVLLDTLTARGDDKLIPAIVWQNLQPLLETRADACVRQLIAIQAAYPRNENLGRIVPRLTDRLLGSHKLDLEAIDHLFGMLTDDPLIHHAAARACLAGLWGRIVSGEIHGGSLEALSTNLLRRLRTILGRKLVDRYFPDDVLVAAALGEEGSLRSIRKGFADPSEREDLRLKGIEVLIFRKDPAVLQALPSLLTAERSGSPGFRAQLLGLLAKLEAPAVADMVLAAYPRLTPDERPRAVELLTQRVGWGRKLLQAIAERKVPAEMLNVNQVRRLLASKDAELTKQVRQKWGTVREGRNPEREQVVNEMRGFLRRTKGDPRAGVAVFKNICGQCHRIHGEGQDVGPDITSNGRASFEQLLSNVFDPSLVIGAAYQATTVTTKSGRSLTGLLVEDTPKRIVLKMQGGKTETVPRDDIEEMGISAVSLMPEGVEKQLKPQEIADLFAFLVLDRPPGDPAARKIPGAP